MSEYIVLNEESFSDETTGAGRLRNACAFTSRDMGADWPEAFTWAIVFGWGDEDYPDEDATSEIAEKFGWDDQLVAFLEDAHKRFLALPDKQPSEPSCSEHKPVQHRDGKPPWCNRCGLTVGFTTPVSRLDPKPRES